MALTKKDLNAIKDLVEVVIDEKELVTKDDIKHLPTKEEFYASQDELMKEVRDLRDEVTVVGEQVRRNTRRVEKVERKVGIVASS